MSDDAAKFLDADIPDPTDFAADAPGLRQLDEALRCTMCRELFAAPVTVNCPQGHCFCSLCIRTALTTKEECPLCRHPIGEFHLRKNPAMEDAVTAWMLARPFVLEILKERNDAQAAAAAQSAGKYFTEKPKSKKRKRDTQASSDDEVVEVEPTSSPPAPPAPSSNPDIVPCPICNTQVALQNINNHIDSGCRAPPAAAASGSARSPRPKSKDQKQAWSKLFQGGGEPVASAAKKGKGKARAAEEELEPLPKVAYDTISQKRLREILDEQGLATAGDKAAMVARHSRWVNMFNANLDASPGARKTLKQLRLELRRWDDAEERRRARGRPDAREFDADEHQKEHRAAFAKLVQAAKPKPPKASQSGEGSSPPVEEGGGGGGGGAGVAKAVEVMVIDD